MAIRTDLAVEAHEIAARSAGQMTQLEGVRARAEQRDGVKITRVQILDERGQRALGKPQGEYVTLEFPELRRRSRGASDKASRQLGRELRAMLQLDPLTRVLVVGLGNAAVTPDAVGPRVMQQLLVTRHLIEQLPQHFGALRAVSAFAPGVLGTTGLESAELVCAAVEAAQPEVVLAVDALASSSLARLFCTVQLTDSGIVPGSGIGNSRRALNRQTLGLPVFAVGIPTVVDAATLVEEFGGGEVPAARGMVVTGKDVDARLRELTRIVAGGINYALHEQLSEEDLAWLADG